jgi:hypothetical protein
MLSKQEIIEIHLAHQFCTCPLCIRDSKIIAEAQHKADLEEWKREKQEMWNDLCKHLEDVEEDITDLEELKDKWGIE